MWMKETCGCAAAAVSPSPIAPPGWTKEVKWHRIKTWAVHKLQELSIAHLPHTIKMYVSSSDLNKRIYFFLQAGIGKNQVKKGVRSDPLIFGIFQKIYLNLYLHMI